MKFIHNLTEWPKFEFDSEKILHLVGRVRNLQGQLSGKMEALGFNLKNEAYLETLSLDIIKSSEIEGERLELDQVRSSIARRLGMEVSGMIPADREVEGVVEMMMDATQNAKQKLTSERLFDWHSAMFPSGRSGMYKIVVSGPLGKEKVHFQAPDYNKINREIQKFLTWFNSNSTLDPAIQAGIAHLWFVTIHPFEDGNGRITRAITDMILSRSEISSHRFYSMSSQIRLERKKYYEMLEKTQKGNLNITPWLEWFLECLERALISSDQIVNKVLQKHQFWIDNKEIQLNERQTLIIEKLLDGFFGKLNTSKWAKINKCSTDTALRDIQDLLTKNILEKEPGGGRSTSYQLK